MTHSRCWNSKSRLKSAREEGASLGQITRAWNSDGSLRFDALAELRKRHPKELGEWSWQNVYDRPDLAIKGVALKTKDNFDYFKPYAADNLQALKFADAGYNAGIGTVDKRRRACKMAPGCAPMVWDGHVEKICLTGTKTLYAGRTACDIVRHHVHDVFEVRTNKYKPFFVESNKKQKYKFKMSDFSFKIK